MATSTIRGWAAWKGRIPHDLSLHRTKRDILIGYDLMPLRGLAKTERFLRSKGIEIVRTVCSVCSPSRRQAFCLSVAGVLDIKSMEWSITHTGGGEWWKIHDPRGIETLTFASACGYAGQDDGPPGLNPDERRALEIVWWGRIELDKADPTQPRDKRRRKKHTEAWKAARDIFERYQMSLAPVRFAKL